MPTDQQLQHVADVSAHARDLEELVRPLLALLADLAGLDNTALTLHDRTSGDQVWRFVHRAPGGLDLPEGFAYPWEQTLCQLLIDHGRSVVADLEVEFSDHPTHTLLGLRGFVSRPLSLVGRDGEVAGTLCGGSRRPIELDERDLAMFDLFARLVADRLGREVELGRERLRADRAERELERRTRFVAASEHAMKTPLSVVRGWSQVLLARLDQLSSDDVRDGLERIVRAGEQLTGQVEAMLGEARASVLATDLRPTAVGMRHAVEELVGDLRAGSPGIDLVVGALDGTALVDPVALEHVVAPLVENASRHAPGSTVTLTATPDGDVVLLVVEDDGPGLPEDLDVFAPFGRGAGPLRPDGDGTGLGLHIVEALVQSSGGTVSAGASAAGGARFEVRLPRVGSRAA